MRKRILLLLLLTVALCVAVWAVVRFRHINFQYAQLAVTNSSNVTSANADAWAQAIARVKGDRSDPTGPVETPPELRHYDDRHWFLASQVAEVAKHNVQTCQDFIDLAAMIQRGEIVAVPPVTDTYILFGVGEKADNAVFSRYENEHSIDIYNEKQLADAYKNLDEKRSKLENEIAALKSEALKKAERTKQSELQKQISARQQELKSIDEDKAQLDQTYGQPDRRQKLFRDYESLKTLASNFTGRSYNLDDSADRHAMKVSLLRSLRPQALKILEEIAAAYHRQFDRPLPVSSLVRPEQYQHALSRVNRNAVLIETPPHSTGLAFDIDYRYMGAAEQTFVMAELARLKKEGRIEVIRERNANYHVFAFLNGTRPSDDLIAASLEKAKAPMETAHHAAAKPPSVESKAQRAKSKGSKSRAGEKKSIHRLRRHKSGARAAIRSRK